MDFAPVGVATKYVAYGRMIDRMKNQRDTPAPLAHGINERGDFRRDPRSANRPHPAQGMLRPIVQKCSVDPRSNGVFPWLTPRIMTRTDTPGHARTLNAKRPRRF